MASSRVRPATASRRALIGEFVEPVAINGLQTARRLKLTLT